MAPVPLLVLLRFDLAEEEFLPRTAVANQSIPSFSPSPCLAEQLCTAHLHVLPSGLIGRVFIDRECLIVCLLVCFSDILLFADEEEARVTRVRKTGEGSRENIVQVKKEGVVFSATTD